MKKRAVDDLSAFSAEKVKIRLDFIVSSAIIITLSLNSRYK